MSKLLTFCFVCIVCYHGFAFEAIDFVENIATHKEYHLSQFSEDYNTNYLFCGDFWLHQRDTTIVLNLSLPNAFVIEVGALEEGEYTKILYNDNKELIIANKKGQFTINGKRIARRSKSYKKLSLYFVNDALIVYQNNKKMKTLKFTIKIERIIGLKLSRNQNHHSHMWNCYEPISFKVADYGRALEEGNIKKTSNVRVAPHNVGEDYNLTFPTDIVQSSSRSIRFEYRYQDTKKAGVNNMLRSRSEISGVFSNSPKNKWIIEFDFLVPKETLDDEEITDIITQIHEGSSTPTSPSFCLFTKGGYLCCTTKGDSYELGDWEDLRKPTFSDSKRFIYLQKDKWYHIKIYLKEGWRPEDLPLTRVWVDGSLLYETQIPNCYKYRNNNSNHFDYLKFGVYNSGWLKKKEIVKGKQTRVYYFDNYFVKY